MNFTRSSHVQILCASNSICNEIILGEIMSCKLLLTSSRHLRSQGDQMGGSYIHFTLVRDQVGVVLVKRQSL